MSLARSDGQGARISLVLAIVFPAMIGAALALAYVGYQDSEDVSSVIEASFRKSFYKTADGLGSHAAEALALKLDLAARVVLDQLAAGLEDAGVPVSQQCRVQLEPGVKAVGVFESLDDAVACVWPSPRDPRLARREWNEDKRRFPWNKVPAGNFNFFHAVDDRGPALFAYAVRRTTFEKRYYVVLKMDLDAIQGDWLQQPLRRIGESYRVALFDRREQPVAGTSFGGAPPGPRERFFYEAPFGRALYMWNIRIAPQEEEMLGLEARMKRQRVVRPLLVIMSTVIIAIGLGIVLLAVMAERRASRLKSDFIANVSHELKTPLSLIRMFGEMVATGRHKGEAAAREYGGIITRESERLSHLIDNVLDFARIERGKASYDFAEGDVAAVLERALDVCRYRLEKEKLKLAVRIDEELPLVRMDEDAVTLVILNLVDNAIKYGADGGEVEVTLGRSPGAVVLAVRDHGAGVPKEEQPRIFDRFYRAQRARESNVRGSGIGLALVKHIAEAHGGRVQLESPVVGPDGSVSPGALFRLYLPASVPEGSESAERHSLPHPLRILKS